MSPFHPIFSNSFGSRRGTNEIEGRSGGSRGSYRFGPRVLGYNGSDEPSRRFTDWHVFCIQHMHRLSQIHSIFFLLLQRDVIHRVRDMRRSTIVKFLVSLSEAKKAAR